VELMRQRENVAALRRRLPPGTLVQDYEFLEGPRRLDDGDEPLLGVAPPRPRATGPGRLVRGAGLL